MGVNVVNFGGDYITIEEALRDAKSLHILLADERAKQAMAEQKKHAA